MKLFLLICLILLLPVSSFLQAVLILCVLLFSFGQKHPSKRKTQHRQAQPAFQSAQPDREALIAEEYEIQQRYYRQLFRNHSILELSGAPPGVTMDRFGLPVPPPGSPFGTSYIVYTALHGTRYHRVQGCCGADTPRYIHLAEKGRYLPCQRCQAPVLDHTTQSWLTLYFNLYRTARLFGVSVAPPPRSRRPSAPKRPAPSSPVRPKPERYPSEETIRHDWEEYLSVPLPDPPEEVPWDTPFVPEGVFPVRRVLPTFGSWSEAIHSTPQQLERIRKAISEVPEPHLLDDKQTAHIQGSRSDRYTVTLNSCTCKDFGRRHLPCKHIYRLAIFTGRFDPPDLPPR